MTDYEWIESAFHLPDPGDRHMLVAAIKCGSGTIVTSNLKDFPEPVFASPGLCAQHPCQILEHALYLDPIAVCHAARGARALFEDLPDALENCSTPSKDLGWQRPSRNCGYISTAIECR
ncbi:hypothetical protein [Arenimonas sp. SCN 70-307]|uniref:hypothetical protein n=1 Tax=Arenimonas sp. SCN 70-307 TaxID=1660089 RepID=UPI0025BD746C|nr:hypothetical protein [Arenimonas sp. SCN 70-307]